jgi:hypothetical protein
VYLINYSVAIVRWKQPFLHWANSLDNRQHHLTPDSIKPFENNCYLLPLFDTEQQKERMIQEVAELIFATELQSYCPDRDFWPKNRNYAMFLEFFDVEVNSMIYDLCEDKGTAQVSL